MKNTQKRKGKKEKINKAEKIKRNRNRTRNRARNRARNRTRNRARNRGKAKGIASKYTKKAIEIGKLNLAPDTKRMVLKEVKREDAAKMIQTINRDYKLKRLKREFTIYERNEGIPDQLDPMEEELADLLERAVNILTGNDIKNIFWKNILGKIYIGLNENENVGGPRAVFYNRTENAFLVLVERMFDNNFTNDPDYLRSEILHKELVVPILGDPENM